jgi:hypothetical protein
MDVLCAFSSDSRTLYVADIYRVLALPNGYIVHFRYKRKYVSESVLSSAVSLEGKRIAIFFTHVDEFDSEYSYVNIPVRWASVCFVEDSIATDVFHIYMKLDDFCELSIESLDAVARPPSKFLSFFECEYKPGFASANWQSRVLLLESYFPKVMFFNLKKLSGRWGERRLSYDGRSKSCYYTLIAGERCALEISLANPKGHKSKIEFSDSSGDVVVSCVNPLETSVQFDDFDMPIFVNSLQVYKQASILNFKPVKDNENFGEYSTSVELELRLSYWRPFLFGGLSVLAAAAILLVAPLASSTPRPGVGEYIVSACMLWFASGAMYYFFNKK